MTNLEALKDLAEAAGVTELDGIDNNLEALNAIALALGGTGTATNNADAIEEIAQNYSSGE